MNFQVSRSIDSSNKQKCFSANATEFNKIFVPKHYYFYFSHTNHKIGLIIQKKNPRIPVPDKTADTGAFSDENSLDITMDTQIKS